MEIKRFIKKYKKYIVIVLTVVALIVIFIFLLGRKKEPKEVLVPMNKEIVSPFMEYTGLPSFALPKKKALFTEEVLNVYSILPYKQSIAEVVYKFDNNARSRYPSEVMDFWKSSSNSFAYYKNTGILKISSPHGLSVTSLVDSKENIKNFISTYFGYVDIDTDNILVKSNPSGGYTYKGKYLIDGYAFGSIYLESYAYVVQTDKDSNINNLSIFLYNRNSPSVYSRYPVLGEPELLLNKRVYIDRLTISENYNKLDRYVKGTINLESLNISEMEKAYIFTDFTEGYIYPMYMFTADARYKDFNEEGYAGDILMYIMAIAQKNISPRENIVEFYEIGTEE